MTRVKHVRIWANVQTAAASGKLSSRLTTVLDVDWQVWIAFNIAKKIVTIAHSIAHSIVHSILVHYPPSPWQRFDGLKRFAFGYLDSFYEQKATEIPQNQMVLQLLKSLFHLLQVKKT